MIVPAILVYTLLVWIAIRVGRTEETDSADPGQLWIYEHLWQPILRAAAIGGLIVTAYPDIFGATRKLPAFGHVLSGGPGHSGVLLDLLLVSSIVLPFVPVIGRLPALILPVQTAIACALIFSWLCKALGVAASFWPTWGVLGSFVVLAVAGHAGGLWLMSAWQEKTGESGGAEWYEAGVLVAQLPAVLIYTHSLGTRLH